MSIDYEVENQIAIITLNRPERLNALTFEIYARLRDRFYELRRDNDVKAIIITGEGKGFCSGGDVDAIIGELLEKDVKEHLDFTRMTGSVVRNMRMLEKPIIAALNGTTAGAGAVLALASDFRLASDEVSIQFLFSKVGLTGADMGAAYLLPKYVGQGRALELLMFGEKIDATTARDWGLINRVTGPDELMPLARDWAEQLVEGPNQALGMTKRLVNNEWNQDLLSALESEAQAQSLMLMGEDHRIFYEAFKNEEEPSFRGR